VTGLRLPGDEEPRGEAAESLHELVAFFGFEGLVGSGGQVVGAVLDALLDGAARPGQPAVVADQSTVA